MSKSISCILAAVFVGSAVSLPAQNTTLKRRWDRSSGVQYNDVWGYTAPDGTEIAVVGETGGIWVLDVTNPNSVKQLKWYSAPSSTWRDMTNIGPYIYVATENRSRGFRVLDCTKPSAIVDVGYVQTSTMTSAHNVSADPDAGFIYFTGSNQGVAIYDVKTNPKNPSLVATWRTRYVHDACIRRGKGYFACGRSYFCQILDVSNVKSIKEIGRARTPGGYSHNAWVTEDDKILCCTDEIARGGVTPHMTVFDISNPKAPVLKGHYDLGSSFIAHNVFSSGRTAYMSHYVDGVHIIDITDPTKPTQIARYDTSTVSRGYNGCWGVYPFADSGIVYGSDLQNGFFAIQVDVGHMNRYGKGTAGSKGVPRIRFDGATPRVGASTLRLELENLEPNKNFWIAVSTGKTPSPLKVLGANVNVNLGPARIIGPISANAQGKASVSAPVPNSGGLANSVVHLQAFGVAANNSDLISSRGCWAGIAKR